MHRILSVVHLHKSCFNSYFSHLSKIHSARINLLTVILLMVCSACNQPVQSQGTTESQENELPKIQKQPLQHNKATQVTKTNTPTKAKGAPLLPILSPQALSQLPILNAMKGIHRWEPSGATVIDDFLWIVSDRKGVLAHYKLPLQQGENDVTQGWKLKPALTHRIKWEGLESDQAGHIWILEAISRSVWHCKQPTQGCPKLTKIDTDALNQMVNQSVQAPFKYVMFEALALDAQGILLGIRGYQHQNKGLQNWSHLLRANLKTLVSVTSGLQWQNKSYGMNGVYFDPQERGFWITWGHEREEDHSKQGVSGLLTFLPQDSVQKHMISDVSGRKNYTMNPSKIKLCMQFPLKPEGVTRWKDQIIVVFDNDKNRKGGPTAHEKFVLQRRQDYAWSANIPTCYSIEELTQ